MTNTNKIPNLNVENLTKRYYQTQRLEKNDMKKYKIALNNVSFCLKPGLYGLLGPNGAGKSTLINIITGGLKQNTGKVLWNGKETLRLGKRFRRILGYMPQQQRLYDSFTGRRFLQYLCTLKEISKQQASDEVERVGASVNLTNELDKRLVAYSGGMKQRLLAAGALLGNPKLLILDEPTAGLDPRERVRLREMMAKLAKERIILIATHVVSDVESVADEILLLKDGCLIDRASPEDLVEKYSSKEGLEDVYLKVFGQEDGI